MGSTIRPLNMSDRFQTRSTLSVEPTTMNATTISAYILVAFLPNSALTFCSPKKYQPMMVENAKNSIQTATNTLPNEPNAALKAACASAVPDSAPVTGSSMPEDRMTSAVSVSTIKVSINTPIMAMTP